VPRPDTGTTTEVGRSVRAVFVDWKEDGRARERPRGLGTIGTSEEQIGSEDRGGV
jgi:hypothetical protein